MLPPRHLWPKLQPALQLLQLLQQSGLATDYQVTSVYRDLSAKGKANCVILTTESLRSVQLALWPWQSSSNRPAMCTLLHRPAMTASLR